MSLYAKDDSADNHQTACQSNENACYIYEVIIPAATYNSHEVIRTLEIFLILFYFYFNICMIDKKYNEYYAPH